jgi:hypothetical protein
LTADAGRQMVMISIVATSVTVGIAFFKNKDRKPGDGFRTAWALGALFLILSMGSDVAPEVFGPLALLILLSTVIFDDATLNSVLHVVPTPPAWANPEHGAGPQ